MVSIELRVHQVYLLYELLIYSLELLVYSISSDNPINMQNKHEFYVIWQLATIILPAGEL